MSEQKAAGHPPPDTDRSRARHLLWLAVSVFLIAFNLRPLFASLSVTLTEIMHDLALTASQASILTTLPVLCLGVFAIPAPGLARRYGTERTLMGALLVILAGTVLRATGHVPPLFIATAAAGAGIAVANVLLPALIKRDFGPWTAPMTGIFTMGLCAGAASAAAFTQPLRSILGGDWTWALAVWALPALLVAIMWLPRAAHQPRVQNLRAHQPGSLWRNRLAWQVTLFMGLQSALAYIVMGWLAPMLRERGMDATAAGYVVGLSIIVQMLATMLTPSLAVRRPAQSTMAVVISAFNVIALLGCLLMSLTTVWVWAIVLGLAQGASIALAIMMIVLRADDTVTASQLSGMAQGVGYTIAAGGPFIVGVLRDYSGNFDAAIYLVIAIGLVLAAAGHGAGRPTTVWPCSAPDTGTDSGTGTD